MLIITREFVDIIAPEHGRTSCSDDNLSNRWGGIKPTYDQRTGKHEVTYPRCTRCYLLDRIGDERDALDFDVRCVLDVKRERL